MKQTKKFRYNPKTLQYEEIRLSFKQLLRKGAPYMFFILFVAAGFTYILDHYFETPEKSRLKAENEFLSQNLETIQNRLENIDSKMNQLAKQDNHIYRVIYQMDSIPSQVRNAGFGGTNRYTKLKGHESSNMVIDISHRLDLLGKKLNIQQNSFNEISEILKTDESRLRALPIIQPVHNEDLTRLGSHFGVRLHPILRIYKMHEGIDLTAPKGTPVYAAGDGIVVEVEKNRSRRGYGNLVIINHGFDGLETRYAHLSTFNVKQGDVVKRGQKIGTVGNTGLSTAPHLHYEIRRNGKPINPLYYIVDVTPEQYDELIEQAKLSGKSFD
jgi:murein DD-endopeptidase MepM/ murein hydrolase activator NlpD